MKPGKCVDRIERMRAVEREHQVASLAESALDKALGQDPSLLTKEGLNRADFVTLQANLEATYVVRLFAEFETGLRDYWKNGLKRKPDTRVRDVMESLASKHKIPDAVLTNAHVVRKYRNQLVHEEDATADSLVIADARKYLCRFFGYLPPDW